MAEQVFVYATTINSFHYLYTDARLLHDRAKTPELQQSFERVPLSRTAILLYVFSLEALVNRALAEFLAEPLRSFVMEREDRFSLEEKWNLLPRFAGAAAPMSFDESSYPWSHFRELVRLRNDFVHPKHDRKAYYRALSTHRIEPLDWKQFPSEMGVRETDLVYRQNRIPRDPYSILPEHVDQVRKVVDDMISELDRLLQGRVRAENWLGKDTLHLVHPPGATLADLSPEPSDG